MKKILAVLLSAAMLLSLLALAGCGSTTEETTTDDSQETSSTELTTVTAGKLTMSTNAQFPPYEMVADDGSFEGIDVEIAAAIAEKLGLELQVDDMDFDSALLAAQNGKSDMVMAGVTITDERMAVMDFSDTYANGVQVVIVKEDSDIASIDDLEGKMIGTQQGTTGYLYCSDTPENGGYGEENVTAYADGATAVQALINGQVDCVVIDNAPAQEFVKANPGLKILDTEFTNENYAIGVAKGNTALLDAINGALKELIADGTVQQIIDKYIPASNAGTDAAATDATGATDTSAEAAE
ncbi:MAG TPA: transporter substrate-binding domain-containing protein [Candidatus Evtepia faecigallinarum]|nr:transporter substrate-binding domain-containing protein [Candidatus Evtepia faecigallinarum]